MRMWNVDVTKMCNKHLLGEHVEMHMFAGTINKHKNFIGYVVKGLVEPHNIKNRHDEIVKEMDNRKMNHKSPLEFEFKEILGKVDVEQNIKILSKRCKQCKFENGKS